MSITWQSCRQCAVRLRFRRGETASDGVRTMPVPPSSPSVGTRYSTYSSYRPSSSSYLGRTTSLDRTPYTNTSTYGGSYSGSYSGYSSYSSKYSLPPRPSYSSTSDTYRSSRSLRQSPARPSYSRISSDSLLESSSPSSSSSSTSRYTSRYLRDSSASRDSGYGSRLTSRDRSVDYVNGNSYNTSHFGASPSSYAANYRWESREKDKTEENDSSSLNGDTEKVRISERIRAFETRTPVRENGLGLLAGRDTLSSSRDSFIGSSRFTSGRDSSVTRRRGANLSTDTSSRSPSAQKTSSESTLRDSRDGSSTSSKNEGEGRRPSVTELCRKYDSNHNVTNGVVRQEDEGEGSDSSVCSGDVATLLSSTRKRAGNSSLIDRTGSPTTHHRLESSSNIHVSSPVSLHKDSPAKTRLDSPIRCRRESPSRRRVDSSGERDGCASPLLNGVLEKVCDSSALSKFILPHLLSPFSNESSLFHLTTLSFFTGPFSSNILNSYNTLFSTHNFLLPLICRQSFLPSSFVFPSTTLPLSQTHRLSTGKYSD